MVRFETELWDSIDRRLRESHNLPLTHFEPMQVIARTQDCRVNDISQELSITVGGTSKLIDRIEANGLCKRCIDPQDRRSSVIELTEAGQLKLDQATQTFEKELEILVGQSLDEESIGQFLSYIKLLRKSIIKI